MSSSKPVAMVVVHFVDESKALLLSTPMRIPVMDAKITVKDFASQVLYRFFNMFNQRPVNASVKSLLVDGSFALFPIDRLLDVVNVPAETITFVMGNVDMAVEGASPRDMCRLGAGSIPSPFLITTPRSKQQPPAYADSPSSAHSTVHATQPLFAADVTAPGLWDDVSEKASPEGGPAVTGGKRSRQGDDDASPAPKPPAPHKPAGVVTSIIQKSKLAKRCQEAYFQDAVGASLAPLHQAPQVPPNDTVPTKQEEEAVAATPPSTAAVEQEEDGLSRSPDLTKMATPERKEYYKQHTDKQNWGTKAHLFFAPNYQPDIDKFIREERKKKREQAKAEKEAAAAASGKTTDPHKVAAKPTTTKIEEEVSITTPPSKVNRSLFSDKKQAENQPKKQPKNAAVVVEKTGTAVEKPAEPLPKGWGPDALSYFPSFYHPDPRKAVVPEELLGQPIRPRRRD